MICTHGAFLSRRILALGTGIMHDAVHSQTRMRINYSLYGNRDILSLPMANGISSNFYNLSIN